MPSDPFSSLADLPGVAETCVTECGRVRRDLVRNSVGRLASTDDASHPIPWLGPVRLRWRFYLAWRQKGFVLFFRSRSRDEIQVVMDSSLAFRIEPTPDLDPAPEPEVTATPPSQNHPPLPPRCRLSWPNFVASTSPEIALFDIQGGTGPRRLELPILSDAIDFPSARLLAGDQPLPFRIGGRYLLEPFVDWIQTLGTWLRSPETTASWRPLQPPGSDEKLPARQILASLLQTFATASTAAASPTRPVPSALELPHRQDIAAFQGKTWLRLRSDGTAIAETDDDDPITLEMGYSVEHTEGRDQLDVRLYPPDFLVDGTLLHQILDTVAQAAIDADWHERDGPLGRPTGMPEEELRRFFATSPATVLRLRRKRDRDQDLLLLRGVLRGSTVWVVLTAWLEIQKPTNPEDPGTRVLRVSKPPAPTTQHGGQALVNGPEKGNAAMVCEFVGERFSASDFVSESVRQSLGRLMLALHRWGGIWPRP